ncbi:hypothetical protein [Mycobacterium sp. MMS18-G62]
MRQRTELPTLLDIDVTTHGRLPGAADYARQKIGALGPLTHRPVLHARVKLTKHDDPAVERPVIAQANLDIAQSRGSVIYHRYDGHYGLITPAG